MTDQHRQALLDLSATYVEANVAFRNVILAAQRDGVDNAEIAWLKATLAAPPMKEAVRRFETSTIFPSNPLVYAARSSVVA